MYRNYMPNIADVFIVKTKLRKWILSTTCSNVNIGTVFLVLLVLWQSVWGTSFIFRPCVKWTLPHADNFQHVLYVNFLLSMLCVFLFFMYVCWCTWGRIFNFILHCAMLRKLSKYIANMSLYNESFTCIIWLIPIL